jgi:hypothetical protein
MTLHSRLLCGAGALALVTGACGKKADSGGAGDVPEVPVAGAPDVPAGSGGSGSRFEREMSRYQLTMDKVRKWAVAAEKLQQVGKEHPELEQKDDTAGFSDKAVAEWTSRVERIPAARKALDDAGLSAREYLLIGVPLSMASVAQVAIQQGSNPDTLAREIGVHPANLRFVQEHRAELAKLQPLLK